MPPAPTPDTPSADAPATQIAAGLAKLALVFRHDAWQATGEHGLTPTQAQILAAVAGAREPMRVSTVAEHLAVTAGTASAAVSTLVEKGLLSKQRSAEDARVVTLALTRRGTRLVARTGAPTSVLDAATTMPTDDQAGLLRGLIRLIRTLQDHGAIPTQRMCTGCTYFRPNVHAGADAPHHCAYVDAPLRDIDLRLDCPEMEPVTTDVAPRLWNVFINGQPWTEDVANDVTSSN